VLVSICAAFCLADKYAVLDVLMFCATVRVIVFKNTSLLLFTLFVFLLVSERHKSNGYKSSHAMLKGMDDSLKCGNSRK